MRGKLWVKWVHDNNCPAYGISVLDTDRWMRQRKVCQCGMPSDWEMGVVNESVNDDWDKRVRNGEND